MLRRVVSLSRWMSSRAASWTMAVAGPAADAGAADAGLRRDLAVGQRGLLDQVAHRRDLRVRMRPARAARPSGNGGRVVRRWAKANDRGIKGRAHGQEYMPRSYRAQESPRPACGKAWPRINAR